MYRIDLEPIGRRIEIEPGVTLLGASQFAGVELVSICGGIGTCEGCRIRLVKGKLTPPTLEEQAVFSSEDLANGMRLACQAIPLSDCGIDIPPESLTTAQRLQVEDVYDASLVNDPRPVAMGYGLAVDVGTTKLAVFLVELA